MKKLRTGWVFGMGLMAVLFCANGVVLAQPLPAPSSPAFTYSINLQTPSALRPLLEQNLDLYRWRGKDRMDAAALKRLVRLAPSQIATLLATEGYYAPTINVMLGEESPNAQVQIMVTPNTPIRVRGVDLQLAGDTNAATMSQIRQDWLLLQGERFRHPAWESAKRAALTQLLLHRFPAASIQHSKATLYREEAAVDLQLQLDTGPAFTFGELVIDGLSRYPAELIQRLNPIEAGSDYAQDALLTLQSRLQDSPYFAEVDVRAEPDLATPSRTPVLVSVRENPSKKLGFGLGMTTDIGAHTQLYYRQLNLFNRLWQWNSTILVNAKKQTLSSELTLPQTREGRRDSLNTYFERSDIEGERLSKFSLEPKRTWQENHRERSLGLRYLQETQDVDGAAIKRTRTLSPSASWTIRATNNALFPTQGYLLNLQLNVASKALLSDQNFVRTLARAAYYHPLGKANQLLLRGEWGAVWAASREGIPSDLLFRTGGDQSVRGYAFQSLGVAEGDGIVGGRYVAVASVEAVHWLSERWGAALFFDAGNAADDAAKLKPVYGYGAGVRWKSAIGPLSLDLAYGQATQNVRLHFSLGVNF